jgi:hypothetical protein
MYGGYKMFVVAISLSTFVTLFLISCAIFEIGAIFIKTSKKEEREWWILDHPNDLIPKRLQLIPNDPHDEKPKFRYLAKVIISFSIFITLAFVILFISVTLEQKAIITDEISNVIIFGILILGTLGLAYSVIYGICRSFTKLGCLGKGIIVIILFATIIFIALIILAILLTMNVIE